MKSYELKEDLFLKLVNYLSHLPYREVADMIGELSHLDEIPPEDEVLSP